MFNKNKKSYEVFKKVGAEKNNYNEELQKRQRVGFFDVAIFIQGHNRYVRNDIKLNEVTHIGFTKSKEITRGMELEGKYQVEFVNHEGRETVLYLKEVTV